MHFLFWTYINDVELAVFSYIYQYVCPLFEYIPASRRNSSTEEMMGPCTLFPRFCFRHQFIFQDIRGRLFSPMPLNPQFLQLFLDFLPGFLILACYIFLFVSQYSFRKCMSAVCNLFALLSKVLIRIRNFGFNNAVVKLTV
jgi:hypothetical protein